MYEDRELIKYGLNEIRSYEMLKQRHDMAWDDFRLKCIETRNNLYLTSYYIDAYNENEEYDCQTILFWIAEGDITNAEWVDDLVENIDFNE